MAEPLQHSPQKLDEIREMLHRQMLDAVSHDLKTPLATIIGSLEIFEHLEEKITPEKKRVLLNTALTEAYRLDNFITNILDMAKLESGRVKVKTESCNLTHLINESVTRLGPKRAACNIQLKPNGEDVTVEADPMLLARALNLVLENAVKYSGKNPLIVLEYGKENGHGFIRVRDHGPGIPPGKEQEIFSKYTRFARADHQKAGTGLGLAICLQLMRLLEGKIAVETHQEGGAVFTLSFPSN